GANMTECSLKDKDKQSRSNRDRVATAASPPTIWETRKVLATERAGAKNLAEIIRWPACRTAKALQPSDLRRDEPAGRDDGRTCRGLLRAEFAAGAGGQSFENCDVRFRGDTAH